MRTTVCATLRITRLDSDISVSLWVIEMQPGRFLGWFAVIASFVLAACETIPRDAFRLSETALATRQMQSREYASMTDEQILAASMGVLQDMGYAIDEVEKPLGVLSASKRADASDQLEEIGMLAADAMQCVFTFMLGCTGNYYGEIDDVQDIRLTLVSRPQLERKDDVTVRVTIQRIIWDKRGRLSKQETVTDEAVYLDLFAKLSKAVFLEQERI